MPKRPLLLAVCALSIVAFRGEAGEPTIRQEPWKGSLNLPRRLRWAKPSSVNARALIPMFENAQVRVWKTILKPGERIGMHRHEHGRVVVALRGGTLRIPQDKGGARDLVLETGKAYWLEADPAGELHGDVNPSPSKPLELMVIEMQ